VRYAQGQAGLGFVSVLRLLRARQHQAIVDVQVDQAGECGHALQIDAAVR
jgi:hypothetical protein